jgi:hypothetical protein
MAGLVSYVDIYALSFRSLSRIKSWAVISLNLAVHVVMCESSWGQALVSLIVYMP